MKPIHVLLAMVSKNYCFRQHLSFLLRTCSVCPGVVLITCNVVQVFGIVFLGVYHRLFCETQLAFTQAELTLPDVIAHVWDLLSGTTAEGCGTLVSLLRRYPAYAMQIRVGRMHHNVLQPILHCSLSCFFACTSMPEAL